ncbi:MAG TPA: amidohydrolase family protein [Gaiellaceae bacterium]
MSDAIERGLELSALYDAEVRRMIPSGADIFDAHLHLGNDIDGMVGDYDALLAGMGEYGISRAFMFCLDEPDRHPAFSAANDRTLAFAARSNGRLVPFVRLDLNESPMEEARRCLDAGARGIKLHPRAQRFDASDSRLAPVFEIAAERRVPILIHGGRGLPPIAEGLAALVERNPDASLIVAHAGIADMAHLASAMAGRKNVFFDTSTWSVIDLLDLFRQVPPEQVVYASDFPYGQQPGSLFLALRAAVRAGLDEAQLRGVLAGNANRLADGEELPEPTRPLGKDTIEHPLQFARIHQYLSMAMPLLWARQQDTMGGLGLALNACAERNGHAETADRIADLLRAAQDLWASLPDRTDEADRFTAQRLTMKMLHIADIEAVTSA